MSSGQSRCLNLSADADPLTRATAISAKPHCRPTLTHCIQVILSALCIALVTEACHEMLGRVRVISHPTYMISTGIKHSAW